MGEKSPPKLVLLFVITLTYGWRAFPSSQSLAEEGNITRP